MRVAAAMRVSTLAVVVTGLAMGCGDVAPTAPDRSMPRLALAPSSPDTVTVIQRLTPIARDVTVGEWVGKAGGTIAIPEAGLKVNVPAGALSTRTYITATAHAGYLVSYEFGPHGTKFRVPLQMQQDAKDLNVWQPNGKLTPTIAPIEAAYFPSRSDIDETQGRARVDEILPVDVDILGSKIHFGVHHFSGYLLASGRK